MAEGRSNTAIARRLIVGPGAVEKHVASIFSKLGLLPSPMITGACWPCSPTSPATDLRRLQILRAFRGHIRP